MFTKILLVVVITLTCNTVRATEFHPVPSPTPTRSAEVDFIIGPQVTSHTEIIADWYDTTSEAQGLYWANQFLNNLPTIFVDSNHYDLPLCLYILYYRTGNVVYRDKARLVAQKWWQSQYINQGNPVPGGDNPGPLYTGTLGLTLWALDVNTPNVFGFLDRVTREWMDVRLLGKINNPNVYTDLREEGYIQLSVVVLARVLPNSFGQITWDNQLNTTTTQVTNGATRRAQYLLDAENIAVNYFGRLQGTYVDKFGQLQNPNDGAWRWAAWNPEPALAAKIAEFGNAFEQPFMIGIYMESVTRLHQLSQSNPVKSSLLTQMTKHCDHVINAAYVANVTPGISTIPKVLLYFYPSHFIFDPTASDRHLTTSVIHTFGYLYSVTGNQSYKTFADGLWNSCFAVVPVDGLRSLMDQINYIKLFTAEFRSTGQYLSWRGTTGQRTCKWSTNPPCNPN